MTDTRITQEDGEEEGVEFRDVPLLMVALVLAIVIWVKFWTRVRRLKEMIYGKVMA